MLFFPYFLILLEYAAVCPASILISLPYHCRIDGDHVATAAARPLHTMGGTKSHLSRGCIAWKPMFNREMNDPKPLSTLRIPLRMFSPCYRKVRDRWCDYERCSVTQKSS